MSKSDDGNVIRCYAKNCEYHTGDVTCTARKIDVGHSHSSTSSETECATFICKGDCDCGCQGC